MGSSGLKYTIINCLALTTFVLMVSVFLGSSEELAKNFLDACSYNLEMAINMFLEGGDEARPQGLSSMSLLLLLMLII